VVLGRLTTLRSWNHQNKVRSILDLYGEAEDTVRQSCTDALISGVELKVVESGDEECEGNKVKMYVLKDILWQVSRDGWYVIANKEVTVVAFNYKLFTSFFFYICSAELATLSPSNYHITETFKSSIRPSNLIHISKCLLSYQVSTPVGITPRLQSGWTSLLGRSLEIVLILQYAISHTYDLCTFEDAWLTT
jgi:hypothetical protein